VDPNILDLLSLLSSWNRTRRWGNAYYIGKSEAKKECRRCECKLEINLRNEYQ
jgi:hypothetical protein